MAAGIRVGVRFRTGGRYLVTAGRVLGTGGAGSPQQGLAASTSTVLRQRRSVPVGATVRVVGLSGLAGLLVTAAISALAQPVFTRMRNQRVWIPPGRSPPPARPHRPGAGRPLRAPALPAPSRYPSRGRAQRRYGTSRRTSASATGVPLRRAYVSRSRTSRGVRGRNPGPPQQLLWNPTPAFSSTARARQAAMSRRRGAANADPAWIIGSAQRGQLRCLARSWGCLTEARQGRQTYEVFAWLTCPA